MAPFHIANAASENAVAICSVEMPRERPSQRSATGAASIANACAKWTLENKVPIRSVEKRKCTKNALKKGLKAPVPRFHTTMAAKNRKSTGLGRRNTDSLVGTASIFNRERGKRARSTKAQPNSRDAR